MKKIYILLILCIIATIAKAAEYAPGDVPNVQLKDSTQLVSDPDNLLDVASKNAINANLRAIRSATTSEPVVVVIGSMPGDYDIDTYATELFELWGLGKKDKDNGLLVLVAVDDHDYVLRTGRGMEVALPDMICGRIGRNIIVPAFRENQYGQGLAEATAEIQKVVTNPKYRDDLVSSEKQHAAADDIDWADIFKFYLIFSLFYTACLGLITLNNLHKQKGKPGYDKYMAIRQLKSISAYSAIFTLGLPLLVYLPLHIAMHRWRDGEHKCPNCKTPMHKIDEVHDNDYLTPAQDAEERFDSVDYDVWVCPTCNEVDIYPFNNPNSHLTKCAVCGARTERMMRDRVLRQPTERYEGQGVKEYECLHCHNRRAVPYSIAKLAPTVIIAPGIGGRGGGGGFGGGSFGGGFGGGSTGGGGFSGKW